MVFTLTVLGADEDQAKVSEQGGACHAQHTHWDMEGVGGAWEGRRRGGEVGQEWGGGG